MKRWLAFWKAFDVARIFPRALLCLATWYVAKAGLWFMALAHPSAEQSAFVTLISVAYAKMLDWYMANGVPWDKHVAPADDGAK